MRYEMMTATTIHLVGYPSEQNWNVSVNRLLNGAQSLRSTHPILRSTAIIKQYLFLTPQRCITRSLLQ
jgi:hypothetical protein